MRSDIAILILGPIEAQRDGSPVHIGGPHLRALLAALVLSANHAVPVDQLAWAVWGEQVPAGYAKTIQSYVSRLRSLLGRDVIVNDDHSYILVVQCDQLDSCRFERLVHAARDLIEQDPGEALRTARAAIELWRGPVLGQLGYREFAHLEVIRLDELRLLAIELQTECELLLGRFSECAARLRALVVEYPYREHFWRLLVPALFRDERRLEAMEAYDEYQEWLERAGLEPTSTFDDLIAAFSPRS